MTTRLKLLCHASTAAVRAFAFPADEPLDAQGQQRLAAFSKQMLQGDRCFTSPALRATQTAATLELVATVEPALRDCDYGRWAGRGFEDVQAQDPQGLTKWLRDPDASPHGGETVVALIARVSAWLDAQKATPGTVVAITHASVIRAAIVCALDAEPRSFWHINVAPLSLVGLSHHGRWTLASMSSGKAEAASEED